MSRWTALGLALVLAACSGSASELSTTTIPTPPPLPSTTPPPAPSTTTPTFENGDVPTLALYLAAIESGLVGTGMEGAAFDEPESLINTGVLFCGLLDEGFGPIDVLRGWVAALSADGATPSEDDLLLGGVVLGAAVKFICPEYLDDLAV